MGGAIILQQLSIILMVVANLVISRRLDKQEDTMVQVLLALSILLKDYDKKHNKNNKATKKGE